MEKKQGIRFSKYSRIRETYDRKTGKLISSYNEREIIVPAGMVNAEREKITARLNELSDKLEIGGEFANKMARIVHNWRRPRGRKKDKYYFPLGRNATLLFKQTYQTAKNEFYIALRLLKRANELGIDDEGKAELYREAVGMYGAIRDQFPKDFPRLYAETKGALKTTAKQLRSWYAGFIGSPKWAVENVTDEAISDFFEKEVEKATQPKLAPERP